MTTRRKTTQVNRFRLRFPFWLDLKKPDEAALAERITDLKARRVFARTMRDGLEIIPDLDAGNLSSLLARYPWVRTAILGEYAGEQGRVGAAAPASWSVEAKPVVTTTPKPVAIQKPDDVTLIVKKARPKGGDKSAENFISSLFGLQQ
jgi:hypothetical protein